MSVILVRISDNVLEDKDHNIYELRFEEFVDKPTVVSQTLINHGVHGHDFLGMLITDLVKWLHWDPTGSSPEMWHEVYDPRKSEWRSAVSITDVRQILDLVDKDNLDDALDRVLTQLDACGAAARGEDRALKAGVGDPCWSFALEEVQTLWQRRIDEIKKLYRAAGEVL